jgi:hypothetical protein
MVRATDAPYLLVNCGELSGGMVYAKISPADAPVVLLYKWSWTRGNDRAAHTYVRTNVRDGLRWRQVKLHRLLLDAPPGTHVDHINHDTLDNRRENLRVVTAQQNQANSRKIITGDSCFKGVCWHKQSNKWRAYIAVNRRQISLGLFDDEVMAAQAYDRAARERFGEYANLNLD